MSALSDAVGNPNVDPTIASLARPGTPTQIKEAAIRLFRQQGYEATTLRQVASEVGIKAGSLYNHLSSKEGLLYTIMSQIMVELQAALDEALDGIDDPVERLSTAIDLHVRFHAERADEVFIGNSELRGLSREHRDVVIGMRDAYEQDFVEIIQAGYEAGAFAVADAKLAARGVLAIATSVATWHQPGGHLSIKEIAEFFTRFTLDGIR